MKTLHPFDTAHLVLKTTQQSLEAHSPAIEAMQPIAEHQLISLPRDMCVAEAKNRLAAAPGVTFLVTGDQGHWDGVVGSAELAEHRILSMVSKTVTPRTLTVADMMCQRDRIQAVTLAELQQATIADVYRTLVSSNASFLLVADGQNMLCGIFSEHEVAERLHLPAKSQAAPAADIVHRLHESHHLQEKERMAD